MRRNTPPPAPTGAVRRDELLTLAELGRRLGCGEKSLRHAQADGLRTIRPPWGRQKLVLGADVLAYFEQLADGGAR